MCICHYFHCFEMCPQAQTQLSSDQRYTIGPELDHYIDIINKNSMEVSHSSKPHFKEAILQLCDEVRNYDAKQEQ